MNPEDKQVRPLVGLPSPVDYDQYNNHSGPYQKLFNNFYVTSPTSPTTTHRLNRRWMPSRPRLIAAVVITLLTVWVTIHWWLRPVVQPDFDFATGQSRKLCGTTDWRTRATGRHSFPVDASHYYFTAKGLEGHTEFEAADDNSTHIEIISTIRSCRGLGNLKETSVNHGGSAGSVFTIEYNGWRWPWDHTNGPRADISVRFPPNREYAWTESRVFARRPQSWTHRIKDMKKAGVSFKRLSLMSHSGDIDVEHVTSQRADVYSVDGNIRGWFDVPAKDLEVKSVHGGTNIITRDDRHDNSP